MQFQHVSIDGFGTLSQTKVRDLNDGLNVIHGVNGSGKTTLLQFIRGVLCGFEDAWRRRLLPPLKGGNPGGTLSLRTGSGKFDVIRHGRAGHADTLAINLIQGSPDDVTALRKQIQTLDQGLLRELYSVSGYEAQNLSGLTALALQHNVELTPRKAAASWLVTRIREVERNRADLLQGTPSQGRIAELEEQRQQIQADIHSAREKQAAGFATWQKRAQHLRREIADLQTHKEWLHQEVQGVETDLTEVQTRLWGERKQIVQEVETVQRPAVEAATPAWVAEIEQIDQEIAHAQQVLRDLAASRLRITVSSADLTGVEVPDPAVAFRRQREALGLIEAQTERLLGTVAKLSPEACRCEQTGRDVSAAAGSIREQLWFLCQELSRQQAAQEQTLLQSQRSDVDRCELELIRQIQRLRLRRDHLVHHESRTTSEQLQFRSVHESAHCECRGHATAVERSEECNLIQPAPQIVVRERTVTVGAARPEDSQRERELIAARRHLLAQRAEVELKLQHLCTELCVAEQSYHPVSEDRTLQQLKQDLVVVEQQLADAREQWQSLALLQTILQRTQEKLHEETPAPVIAEASSWMKRMTDGRYPEFRFHEAAGELRIINHVGAELTADALSRGTLEQAALSFRLALCSEFNRRGIQLPLVLDDVLADSDEQRLRAAAEVLVDYGKRQQILFFTCQDHLVSLFETLGVLVRDLPGSVRTVRTTEAVEAESSESAPEPFLLDRLQPDEPYWLQAESPVDYVPSLGAQMARRLGALGIRTAADLIELDPEVAEIPLGSLQISAATLRQWQAEARLLCCVPDLTGRDVQLLVTCGIFSPAELAECDVDDLQNRVKRLHARQASGNLYPWLATETDWPSRDLLSRWIRRGQAARTWQKAREWSNKRRWQVRSVDPAHPTPRQPHVRFHPVRETLPATTEHKFYLHLSSPVVDAPSIGPRTAERLEMIGILQVDHLLQRDAAEVSALLNRREVTADVVTAWQHQAELVCRIPELRGHDAQVLVACGLTSAERIASMNPSQVFALVEPFVHSREGQRLLRSAKTPDLAEVTEWISQARTVQLTRAA